MTRVGRRRGAAGNTGRGAQGSAALGAATLGAATLAAITRGAAAATLTAMILPARADAPPPAPRVEARSAELLAVGMVHGDRMTIHITRLTDNAPIRDANVSVLLRGATHLTVAEADGGYAFKSPDLAAPGNASLVFEIVRGGTRLDLRGELAVDGGAQTPEQDSSRQLWWWALNFGVCGGFLMLLSRRRKRKANESEEP